MEADAQLVLLLRDGSGNDTNATAAAKTVAAAVAAAAAADGNGASAASTSAGAVASRVMLDEEYPDPPPVPVHIMSGLRTLFMLPAFHSQCRTGLNLAGTQLMALPDEVGGLGDWTMRRLDLCNNTIPHLPTSIHQLKRLTVLIMHNNWLSTVPDEIGRLRHLKVLGLANNRLTALPHTVSQLRSLTKLDAEGNRIKFLPHSLGTGPASYTLTHLNFASNKLEAIPVELCMGRPDEDDENDETVTVTGVGVGQQTEQQQQQQPGQAKQKTVTIAVGDAAVSTPATVTATATATVTANTATAAGGAGGVGDGTNTDKIEAAVPMTDPRCMSKLQVLVLSSNLITADGLPDQIRRLPSLHTLLVNGNRLDHLPFLVTMGEEAGKETQEENDWEKELPQEWDDLGLSIPLPPPPGPKPPLRVLDLSGNNLIWWTQPEARALVNAPLTDEEQLAANQITGLCRMSPTLRFLDISGNREIIEDHVVTLARRLRMCEVTNTLAKEDTAAARLASRFKVPDGTWEDGRVDEDNEDEEERPDTRDQWD
jgi:hypothetical protein